MNEVITGAVIRTVFAYILVICLTRLIGRKLISGMTFFDFVVGVTLGSTTANLAVKPDLAPAATTVLITLTVLAVIIGVIRLKSFRFRKTVDSEPVVLVSNGQIIAQNLRKIRLSVNELLMLLREKNYFDIGDVEFALIEADGKVSVLPKSPKRPLTPGDMNIATEYKGLSKDLIIDGEILTENLHDVRLDENWLQNQLKAKGVGNVAEVFYAGLDSAGNLYVSQFKRQSEKHGKYGID